MGWAVAAEAVIGYAGSVAARKAANKQGDLMSAAAAPGMQAQAYALPRLRGLIENVLAPEVDRQDPLLQIEHQMNLAGIGRQERTSSAEANFYYGSQGNVGRSRGEQLRIASAAEAARGKENLGYGMAENARRSGALGRLTQTLESLGGLSATGVNAGMNAAQAYGGAGRGYASDLVGIGTGLLDDYKNKDLQQAWLEWLKQSLKKGGGGGASSPGYYDDNTNTSYGGYTP